MTGRSVDCRSAGGAGVENVGLAPGSCYLDLNALTMYRHKKVGTEGAMSLVREAVFVDEKEGLTRTVPEKESASWRGATAEKEKEKDGHTNS